MSLASNFLDQLKERDQKLFKRFDERLSTDEKGKELILRVHAFDREYSIDELNSLQRHWDWFVPISHIGFTATPLLVNGRAHHSIPIEFSVGH